MYQLFTSWCDKQAPLSLNTAQCFCLKFQVGNAVAGSAILYDLFQRGVPPILDLIVCPARR